MQVKLMKRHFKKLRFNYHYDSTAYLLVMTGVVMLYKECDNYQEHKIIVIDCWTEFYYFSDVEHMVNAFYYVVVV